MALMCAFTLSAQSEKAPEKKAKKVKEAIIYFENTTHDYGTILKGSDGTCEFVFKNKGKAPLQLINVRASCGCTVPEWPKDPIPPSKSAVIKVKYSTQKIGHIGSSITVESNATNNNVKLQLSGMVSEEAQDAAPSNTQTPLSVPQN